jgi:uncharacterized protein (TIGR03032 family)
MSTGSSKSDESITREDDGQCPLASLHTTNFPLILDQLESSLLVTTYQAGKLVIVRASNGVLNTHFRSFNKPMGSAVGDNRVAIGTATEIWEFRNVPAVTSRLEPRDKYDACYLPRRAHITGDIQIHEMTYVGNELSFVNTRFSCLATTDPNYSFVPTWRPKFISQLTPDDRCHLNGLGIRNGVIQFVTALGETDGGGTWRENKKSGGILIDVEQNEIITRGLSMPHSPRWHAGRIWLLESGTGSLGFIDPNTLRYEPIVFLPGFTRGLDLTGNLAFVGLSQVRESAVFSGIPITERLNQADRACGVWAIDIERGQVVAFLKFQEAVQEIFAVSLLRGVRFPDLINDDPEILGSSFVLPDVALRDVPGELRNE